MKHVLKLKTVAVAFALLSLPYTVALCQDDSATSKAEEIVKKLDTNEDSKIDKEEAKSDEKLSKKFGEIDTDADGYIDKKELEAHLSK